MASRNRPPSSGESAGIPLAGSSNRPQHLPGPVFDNHPQFNVAAAPLRHIERQPPSPFTDGSRPPVQDGPFIQQQNRQDFIDGSIPSIAGQHRPSPTAHISGFNSPDNNNIFLHSKFIFNAAGQTDASHTSRSGQTVLRPSNVTAAQPVNDVLGANTSNVHHQSQHANMSSQEGIIAQDQASNNQRPNLPSLMEMATGTATIQNHQPYPPASSVYQPYPEGSYGSQLLGFHGGVISSQYTPLAYPVLGNQHFSFRSYNAPANTAEGTSPIQANTNKKRKLNSHNNEPFDQAYGSYHPLVGRTLQPETSSAEQAESMGEESDSELGELSDSDIKSETDEDESEELCEKLYFTSIAEAAEKEFVRVRLNAATAARDDWKKIKASSTAQRQIIVRMKEALEGGFKQDPEGGEEHEASVRRAGWKRWQLSGKDELNKFLAGRGYEEAEMTAWMLLKGLFDGHRNGLIKSKQRYVVINRRLTFTERVNMCIQAMGDYPLVALEVLTQRNVHGFIADPDKFAKTKWANCWSNFNRNEKARQEAAKAKREEGEGDGQGSSEEL